MIEDTNKISEKDRAYFAGLFDGEGCVVLEKHINHYNLKALFGMTYAPILYEMRGLFGGKVYKTDMETRRNSPSVKCSTNTNPENLKQTYQFQLYSKEAWIFLKIIEPYCREKKEQVHTGIEFFQGYRGGRGSGLSKSQIERCEYYYKKLQELKKSSGKINNNILEFEDAQQTLSFCSEE